MSNSIISVYHKPIPIPAVAVRVIENERNGTCFSFHKVCHEIAVIDNYKGIFSFCGNHFTVLCPINKGITFVGRGNQRALSIVIIFTHTRDSSAFLGENRSGDVEFRAEMSHQMPVACNGEGIIGIK